MMTVEKFPKGKRPKRQTLVEGAAQVSAPVVTLPAPPVTVGPSRDFSCSADQEMAMRSRQWTAEHPKGPPRPLAIPVVAPKTVAIVAMGKSSDQYIFEATNKGGRGAVADEIWAIGNQGGVIQCDRIFMMNDLDRAYKAAQEHKIENVMESFKWLRECHVPVYVSKAHPEFPSTVDYPLDEVIKGLKYGYLNGSVAYAIGFAYVIGVQKLKFYGCDYTYPDNHVAEKGRACVEFWLMKWLMEGRQVELAHDTSLLDNNVPLGQKFYGYSDDVRAEVVDGETRIVRRPLMPDAAD